MFDSIELILRLEKGEELTWEEMDTNLSRIKDAVNYVLRRNFQKDFEGVEAGKLEVVHNRGLMPVDVVVWQKVTEDEWIPVATPAVSYKEGSITTTVFIEFPAAPGTIKVFVKF